MLSTKSRKIKISKIHSTKTYKNDTFSVITYYLKKPKTT